MINLLICVCWIHQSNKYKEFEPAYIFIKKDIDHYKVQITAINKNDPEDGMIYKTDETVKANLDDSINVYPLFEWQWNIDEDIWLIWIGNSVIKHKLFLYRIGSNKIS